MANTPLYSPILEERKKFRDYRYHVRGDSFNWFRQRSWETIKHLIIHHTDTKPSGNPQKDVDYVAYLHCEPEPKGNGWDGVGYHFIITPDGMVWYVGDISMQRANVAGKNHLVIGIGLIGQFHKHNPTDEQILSAHDLCKYLKENVPALTSIRGKSWFDVVKGHSDLQATVCPGPQWRLEPGGSMFWRIKSRTPYTPQPQPEPVIDWKKRYEDLKIKTDELIEKLQGEKTTALEGKTKAETDLADFKEECGMVIDDLTEKLENAKKENPKIPTIDQFPESEVLDQATKIIVARLARWLKKLNIDIGTNGKSK